MDSQIRNRVIIVAVLVSVGLAWLFAQVTTTLGITVPWWIDAPSVMGFFGLVLAFYNVFLWKTWPFRVLPWFYIPNLSGKWVVKIESSYRGLNSSIEGTAVVRQTAFRMCISLQTPNSSSYSTSASLLRTDRFSTHELVYHYQNSPKPGVPKTMAMHHGTTWLQVSDDGECLEGEYYTGRGRQNYGTIVFTRPAS